MMYDTLYLNVRLAASGSFLRDRSHIMVFAPQQKLERLLIITLSR